MRLDTRGWRAFDRIVSALFKVEKRHVPTDVPVQDEDRPARKTALIEGRDRRKIVPRLPRRSAVR